MPASLAERIFQHLAEVGQASPVALAALFCVPLHSVIKAIGDHSDFRRVAGDGCWHVACCPLALCRRSPAAYRSQEAAVRAAQRAAAKAKAPVASPARTAAPRVVRSEIFAEVHAALVELGEATSDEIAARLGRPRMSVYYQLRAHRDQFPSRPAGGGGRARLYSVAGAA